MVEKVFSTRIEDELQREFRSIIVRKGMTVGAVVRQLMQDYIIREGGTVPQMTVTAAKKSANPIGTGKPNVGGLADDDDSLPHIPNAETAAAIEECRARRGKRASNPDEFFEAMHNAADSIA